MKIDPNAPAYPSGIASVVDGNNSIHTTDSVDRCQGGMTIRTAIAAKVLAGLAGDSENYNLPMENAALALLLTDALIDALNAPSGQKETK